MKKCSEVMQTLRAGCSKADPQTNTQTDSGNYNTLRRLARSVITLKYTGHFDQCPPMSCFFCSAVPDNYGQFNFQVHKNQPNVVKY